MLGIGPRPVLAPHVYIHLPLNPGVNKHRIQRAKKVVSDSPGLVDFAFGLVNSVLNLPDVQVMFFEEFKLKKNCEINSACRKAFGAS